MAVRSARARYESHQTLPYTVATLQARRELQLDLSLHGDRLAELGDQRLEAQFERLQLHLERGLLADVLPVDSELLVLGFELDLPQGAVGVLDLVEVELLAPLELRAVVGFS